MGQSKYRIFELSARAVMSYAAQEDGQWHFALDRAATEKCKRVSALHEQDGNALFFQIMCVVQGDDFSEPTDDRPIEAHCPASRSARRRPGICSARRVCVWIWDRGCIAISPLSGRAA